MVLEPFDWTLERKGKVKVPDLDRRTNGQVDSESIF